MPYLVKILAENIRRYHQLKMLIEQTKKQDNLLKTINAGLENSIGLMESLPLKDNKILSDLRNYHQSYNKVIDLYGKIPKSKEDALQKLHDQIVAESMQITSNVMNYSKTQEENAVNISIQAREASPKGAARMQVETSAQILHTLNQLLKVNGQLLKLQGQNLATSNKHSKESVDNYQQINSGVNKNFKGFKPNMKLIDF